MEPLNLMVSLSHFANAERENEHGLSQPAGRGRRTERKARRLSAGRNVRRIWASRVRVTP
ncbi:hypothetical protein EV649_7656 [Kribbella sp. VKM Ac-2569]|uniref:hypothetical protein n=1 Tax=Kribbella sp. VKM Ac-2569 TaxID=2512220 RepID=UPI00102C1DFD|nr:hypothetical protein [Kribbella sp. VKM Ac-2569]RZT12000.1 hypothetical protein EV649_7656 [Kribbella sp. VKM Ac-2569]